MATLPQGARRHPQDLHRVLLPALATVALVLTATAAHAEWGSIPAASWNEVARPDSGGRDAIVLLARGEVTDGDDVFTEKIFRRVLVLTTKGAEAARIEVDLDGDKWRITGIRARSVHRDGGAVDLRPDQIFTTTRWKIGRQAVRRTTFIVPGVEPGAIFEYACTIDGPGRWSMPWYLQGDDYTVTSEFVWRPSEWLTTAGPGRSGTVPPMWLLQRTTESEVTIDRRPAGDNPREVRFTAHALAGLRDEPLAPPVSDAAARVLVGYGELRYDQYWSYWKGRIGRFIERLQLDPGPLTALTQDALKRTGDPERALHEVHDWLRAHIVPVEQPSWSQVQSGKPPSVDYDDTPTLADMFGRGQGLNFEINVALLTAAQQLGMSAHLVNVRDRRQGSFTPEVKGWPPAGEVVAVQHPDGRVRYHQPASRFARYASVPWEFRGASGLRTGGERLFETIPCEDDLGALTVERLRLRLDPAGDATGELLIRIEGEAARSLRATLWSLDPARWRESMTERIDLPPGVTLEYDPVSLGTSPDSAMELRAKVTMAGVAMPAGRDLSLTLDRLLPWRIHARITVGQRTLPLDFRYPKTKIEDVTLELPEGVALKGAVPPARFENALGTWEVTAAAGDGVVHVVRRVDLLLGTVAPKGLPLAAELLNGLDDRDRVPLLLRVP